MRLAFYYDATVGQVKYERACSFVDVDFVGEIKSVKVKFTTMRVVG